MAKVFYAVKDSPEEKILCYWQKGGSTRESLDCASFWNTLDNAERCCGKIIETCQNVSTVYYDVTPKPPATIEME